MIHWPPGESHANRITFSREDHHTAHDLDAKQALQVAGRIAARRDFNLPLS